MNGECSTGKERHATARGAYAYMKGIKKKRCGNGRVPIRVHYCKMCQGYHLTSYIQTHRTKGRKKHD